jgi:thioredoxin 2
MKVICPHCLATNNIPKLEVYKKVDCGKCKKSFFDVKPIELNSDTMDKIISRSEIPVIVDFWAPWCGPCKSMSPVFKRTANAFPLKMLFAKVNVEDEKFLGSRFKIRSIPTIIVFKNGAEINRTTGAMDAESLEKYVERFI